MDQERPDEGLGLPGDPTEGKSAEDRGKGLDLGFADVSNGKGHSLQPKGFCAKFPGISKQQPAAENEFPSDQIEECGPGQALQKSLIIFLHGCISTTQEVYDRSHD